MYQSLYLKTAIAGKIEKLTNDNRGYLFGLSFGLNDGLLYGNTAGNEWQAWVDECIRTFSELDIPAALSDRLLGLRLLHHVPLAYLVPDPALLPPESIRFFHVDQAWTDRLVEGALYAANIGTADLGYSTMMHYGIRKHLDDRLKTRYRELGGLSGADGNLLWKPGESPMTGMLIRSELVMRWPEMLVNAFSQEGKPTDPSKSDIPILRKDLISKNIMIILFAGNPKRIEIREPACGTRFGVDKCIERHYPIINKTFDYCIIKRRDAIGNLTGKATNEDDNTKSTVMFQYNKYYRKLDINNLRLYIEDIRPGGEFPERGYWNKDIRKKIILSEEDLKIDNERENAGGRDVAIHLSQPPYVQVFRSDRSEQYGASSAKLRRGILSDDQFVHVPLRNGRFFEVRTDVDISRGESV